MNRCCPNAVKESKSERVGLYRNEQGGFACLALLKIIQFFIGVIDHIVGTSSTGREQIPATKKKYNQCNAQYYACSWHGNMNVFWANATSNRLDEIGLNTRFKFKLHMWLFKCHLIDLCQTAAISCSNMHENGTDGFLEFFW